MPGRHQARIARIESIRSIGRDDLPRLAKPRDNTVLMPLKLRESHREVARLLALGLTQRRVAEITGYSTQRVMTLAATPAIKDLIADFRSIRDESYAEEVDVYYSYVTHNAIHAERMLSDKLHAADEEGELLPTKELIAISRDAADRIGYGKKQTNINVNADFAAQLEAAIRRTDEARGAKLVDGSPIPVVTSSRTAPDSQEVRSQALLTKKERDGDSYQEVTRRAAS